MEKNKRNILIVEDDFDLRETIKDILEIEGHNIFEADNVKNALLATKNNAPDLIISDILMPGESGIDLLKKIRSVPEFYNLPFIFLTAQSDSRQVRDGMNLGADDYITKPFRKEDLITSVNHRLEKKHILDKKLELFYDGISKYVPHELRTPLVAILGYPELVKENYDDLDKTEIFDIMNNIAFAGKRMQDTLEKFIIYTEVKSNDLKNELNLKSQFTGIESSIDIILSELEQKNYGKREWKINIEEHPVRISGQHFSMILKQLLENSLKFSDEESSITISGKINNSKYNIEIEDEGIGIKDETLSQLGAFIQLNREEKQQSGNGLGLVIVNKILDLYGYKLNIFSTYQVGTKISFSLDICE